MKKTTTRTAVILFNLGGPDKQSAVRPFLFNLFFDPAIIRLPAFFRFLIAKLISSRREDVAKKIYAKMGGGSPILKNTEEQARALEKTLGENFKCFVAMRYWHPFADEVAPEVKLYAPDEIILLPLYPQYSTTTTASSFKDWRETAQKAGISAPTKAICCYPDEAGFIEALAANISNAYEKAKAYGAPRLLLSAHGLPEKIVRDGDPYQWQCEKTAEAVARAVMRAATHGAGIPGLDAVLCYQSRVGPLQWIGPSTESEVLRAAKEKKPVIIAPIAFVSEHSETLVEIDMEYRELALKKGSPAFFYAPAVAANAGFIRGLAGLVKKAAAGEAQIISERGGRICPPHCDCPN